MTSLHLYFYALFGYKSGIKILNAIVALYLQNLDVVLEDCR